MTGRPQSGYAALHYPPIHHETWLDDAACVGSDPEMWFPHKGEKAHPLVIQICRSCPAHNHCLEYALKHRIDHGIWGGYTERQRRQIRRKEGAA